MICQMLCFGMKDKENRSLSYRVQMNLVCLGDEKRSTGTGTHEDKAGEIVVMTCEGHSISMLRSLDTTWKQTLGRR